MGLWSVVVEWAAMLILAGLSLTFRAQMAVFWSEMASTGVPGFFSMCFFILHQVNTSLFTWG